MSFSKTEAARQLVNTARQGTASAARKTAATPTACQIAVEADGWGVFQHGDIVPGHVTGDIKLCKNVEQRLRLRGPPESSRQLPDLNPNGIACGRKGRVMPAAYWVGGKGGPTHFLGVSAGRMARREALSSLGWRRCIEDAVLLRLVFF